MNAKAFSSYENTASSTCKFLQPCSSRCCLSGPSPAKRTLGKLNPAHTAPLMWASLIFMLMQGLQEKGKAGRASIARPHLLWSKLSFPAIYLILCKSTHLGRSSLEGRGEVSLGMARGRSEWNNLHVSRRKIIKMKWFGREKEKICSLKKTEVRMKTFKHFSKSWHSGHVPQKEVLPQCALNIGFLK